jgi:hypothetical protein
MGFKIQSWIKQYPKEFNYRISRTINEFNGINEIIVRLTGVIVEISIDHYRGIIKVRIRKDNKFGFISVKG